MYGSVADGGGRGAESELWLEGRACSMLTVMLGGDLDVVWVRVGVRNRVGVRRVGVRVEVTVRVSVSMVRVRALRRS